jgi:uncharacterized repeat protein (TIGR01451 family)
MSRFRVSSLFAITAILPACLAGQPLVRVLNPSTHIVTATATVSLSGVASAGSAIVNVYWVDQQGNRGPAQWTAGAGVLVNWTADVPVRPGSNRITVVAVDSGNQSGSVQFSVHSEAAPAPPVTAVRSGWWQGLPVTYAESNGWAVTQGDIILGTAEQLATSAPMGPGAHPDGFSIGYVAQLWPLVDGVYQIPYTIQTGTPILASVISYVNSTLSGVIQFVPQTSQTNYVTFNFDPSDLSGYCEASEGMAGGQQFIGGSINCSFAGTCHEMGHAIGLLHEHQRPDRNSYVVLTPANADKPYLLGDFDLFADDFQVIGLYDYASVMQYPAFSFTKNNLPVLESIPAGIPLSNSVGYSPGDVDAIKRLYGMAPSSVTVTTNPAGLNIIVDGTTYAAPRTFTWPLNSTHTLNLPADPQVTSPSDGATYEFAKWNDGGARSHSAGNGGGSGLLTSPAAKPATTVYEANFIRLWPYTSSATPAGSGSVSVSPAAQLIFSGSFFVDRQQITVTATPKAGNNFYGWFNAPYPQRANPYPFLVQAPESTLEGVFTTFPVTIIGESITGPNTWNPPLYATVDSDNFVDLPQGYSQDQSGSAWAPGTSHTISAPSPDVPVTTNVSYTWNNWSDGGAQTHAITAASSGKSAVTASFTPVYRSYTYAQNTCASVVYSQACPNNDCSFPDGTLITMTASTTDPAMVFAGWTGDLSGTINPQTTTIHDEFLPVANFNLVPSIITATGVSPASPVKSSAASNLTVTGAGFVSGSFYTYWNNNYRANTNVSATQATVQLSAGDLANAGSQLLQVSNFTPSGCGALAFTQVLIKNSVGSARLTITKSHQGSFTQGQANATYTVTASNQSTATGPTSGKVTVTDTIPTGLTLVSMAGTGWTCTANSCQRTDALGVGKSYPAITVTVNVSATAPPSVTNTVTVSGGDSPAASAANPTTIN